MVPKISNHVGCLKFLAQAVPKKCQQEEEGRPEASRFRTSKLSDPTTDRPGLRDLSGKVQDLTPEPCLARPQSSRGGLLGVRQSVATAQPWHQQHIICQGTRKGNRTSGCTVGWSEVSLGDRAQPRVLG